MSSAREARGACLPMTEEVLHDMKPMLNFCPHIRLEVFQLFHLAAEFVVGQRLSFGSLHCDVPGHALAKIFFALFNALVAGITMGCHFIAMQQSVRLSDVGDVARSAHDGVNKTRCRVHADVRLGLRRGRQARLRGRSRRLFDQTSGCSSCAARRDQARRCGGCCLKAF
jgi:hypothetical protein